MTDMPVLSRRVPRPGPSATTPAPQIDALPAEEVVQLVQARGWPSVTVLLDTEPAERMQPADGERLQELLDEVDRRLVVSGAEAPEVRRRLAALARGVQAEPTGRGLALFASPSLVRRLRLPVRVEPRVVVEGTFRTREVLHCLHRTPPYLLLVLRSTSAQLYRGHADTLVPAGDPGFPVEHSLPTLGVLESGDDRIADFVARVDAALARARERRPAPIVVAGDVEPVRRLLRGSRHLDRLAGVVTGRDAEWLPTLYTATRLSVEEYLRSREAEAVGLLASAMTDTPQHVHSGVADCWDAVHARDPVMLVVEEGHTVPAVVDADGRRFVDGEAAVTAGLAQVHSDLVDDLVETVIDRGGWVAFTRNGRLADHDRVALVTRD